MQYWRKQYSRFSEFLSSEFIDNHEEPISFIPIVNIESRTNYSLDVDLAKCGGLLLIYKSLKYKVIKTITQWRTANVYPLK